MVDATLPVSAVRYIRDDTETQEFQTNPSTGDLFC